MSQSSRTGVRFQRTEIRKRCVNFIVNIIGDHTDDVNKLGRSVQTIDKNTETLVVASK